MEHSAYKRFIRRFWQTAAVLLLLAAAVVVVFDPFYHYHGPVFGLKAVVTKSEYQCIGTIRNFDYDSVLCGSSTAENYHNGWFDEGFGAKTVKAIKSSATAADLHYYLQEAFAARRIGHVFYSLDLFSLDGDPETDFVNDSMPLYLFDRNILNDIQYIWNRDVLFEDIPYLLAMNLTGGYDEGTSYNWWQYKTFSEEETLSHYERSSEAAPVLKAEDYRSRVDGNLDLIEGLVRAHPETEFVFLLPPYSLLWWDGVNRSGQLQEYFYARRQILERLVKYGNARIYDFQGEEEIILDLDHYMDPVHFGVDINRFMAEEAKKEDSVYRVTGDNREDMLEGLEKLVMRILVQEIDRYFPASDGQETGC